VLRPGQFVRVHILGLVRPNAVVVPQRAVQQGAKGHFVWVANKENKAEPRPVVVGDWIGDDIFINEGLRSGERIVVDGGLTLAPGAPVAAEAFVPDPGEAAKSASSGGKKQGRD
jgi:membrane fusion protein (multidrug efflux system)